MAPPKTPEEAKAAIEAARAEMQAAEKEIMAVKEKIKELSGQETAQNMLELVVLKIGDLPETAKPSVKFELSSPIEEAVIDKLFDPLEPSADGSVAKFAEVDTSVATLTLEVKDADIVLGCSAAQDVSSMCDTKEQGKELEVKIYANLDDQDEKSEGGQDEAKGEPVPPVCTITLRIKFTPSAQDLREELYDQLNSASQKKRKAVETMRESAVVVSRNAPPSTKPKSSMQGGFLQKSSDVSKKPKSKLAQLYETYLGPQSFGRRMYPICKNYVLFFGFAAFFHFKGQLFALPAPV